MHWKRSHIVLNSRIAILEAPELVTSRYKGQNVGGLHCRILSWVKSCCVKFLVRLFLPSSRELVNNTKQAKSAPLEDVLHSLLCHMRTIQQQQMTELRWCCELFDWIKCLIKYLPMPVHSLRGRQPSANYFLSRFENVVRVVVLWQLQCAGIAWLGSSLSYEAIDLCATDSLVWVLHILSTCSLQGLTAVSSV